MTFAPRTPEQALDDAQAALLHERNRNRALYTALFMLTQAADALPPKAEFVTRHDLARIAEAVKRGVSALKD